VGQIFDRHCVIVVVVSCGVSRRNGSNVSKEFGEAERKTDRIVGNNVEEMILERVGLEAIAKLSGGFLKLMRPRHSL